MREKFMHYTGIELRGSPLGKSSGEVGYVNHCTALRNGEFQFEFDFAMKYPFSISGVLSCGEFTYGEIFDLR
jgi:hypothetical protein